MQSRLIIGFLTLFVSASAGVRQARPADGEEISPPASVLNLSAKDHPHDGGEQIDLSWSLSADDSKEQKLKYKILRGGEKIGVYKQVDLIEPSERDYRTGRIHFTAEGELEEEYYFRVVVVNPHVVVEDPGSGKSKPLESEFTEVGPVRATGYVFDFDGSRIWLAVIVVVLCGSVVYWIQHARSGKPLNVRKIPGLEAVDEAVGRATEMGRSCVFVPGIQDMNDIQTIAGLTILSRVAKTAAEYDAKVEVPTTRSLVMTAARETVQAAYLSVGRPDAYNEDLIYYVTDEQFGYVAYMSGMMVREKPAACFYMGSFFAESLILAETGNSIGAIQVAGTAQPSQLPFFVAACDFTLIGEEFFAASAYLSGEPEQLGSLKGQDVGKIVVGAFLLVGCAIATLAMLTGSTELGDMLTFLTDTMLK